MIKANSEKDAHSATGVIRLSNLDDFTNISPAMIKNAIRTVDIISNDMAIAWLGHIEVIDALKTFILNNRRAQLRILLEDASKVVRLNHPLVPLIKKVSRIEARVIDADLLEKQPLKHEFILLDRGGVILKQKPDQYIGFAHQDDKTTVKQQKSSFEQYWRYSQPSPELRYFSL